MSTKNRGKLPATALAFVDWIREKREKWKVFRFHLYPIFASNQVEQFVMQDNVLQSIKDKASILRCDNLYVDLWYSA